MSEITNNKKGTMLERATMCFLYAILCIFPLIFVHYYADILYVKYYFYVGCAALLIIAAAIYGILYLRRNGKGTYKVRTTAAEKFMMAFLLVAVVSTLQSDYFYESFWGNEGRLTGLFLILLYVACFFIIGRFGSLKRKLLDAFLFVGNLVCLFGITDYFQMDILGFKENMASEQLLMFTSTIGNINIYTAVAAMFAAVAMILFVTETKKNKKVYYYVTLIICLLALTMAMSDNAYVSLLVLFGMSPLYLFQYRWGVKGYWICVATLLSLILGVRVISETIPSAIGLWGVIRPVAFWKNFPIIVAAVWLCLAAVLWLDRKNEKEEVSVWWRRGWIGLIIVVIAAVLYVLYDCNIAGNAEKYAPIQSYVLFNERWGTNRGYIWGASLECYQNFPWYRKLVGFGPDTFGILTYNKYRPEAFRLFGEIYDSPHNEYLQYLVTMGAAGLIFYLAAVFATIKQLWQKQKENPMAMAVLFALICYWAQAVVNINIPISAALMWTLWGIAMASCREKQ
ncbi:MAG: O-antigen ligase family protein [Lachnospiraceae bacterium]|jgi:hypothetical protein